MGNNRDGRHFDQGDSLGFFGLLVALSLPLWMIGAWQTVST